MTGSDNASVIETMAKHFYVAWAEDKGLATDWARLKPDDRRRFVSAMARSVEHVPDRFELSDAKSTLKFSLSEGRTAILAEHQQKYLLPPNSTNNTIKAKQQQKKQ